MVDILASGSTLIQVCDDPLEFLEQGGYRRRHNFECFDDGKHSYYSDVGGGKSDSTEGGDASIKNLYLRFRFICSNIVDGKWKPEEEQEISVFVKEFGCKLNISSYKVSTLMEYNPYVTMVWLVGFVMRVFRNLLYFYLFLRPELT